MYTFLIPDIMAQNGDGASLNTHLCLRYTYFDYYYYYYYYYLMSLIKVPGRLIFLNFFFLTVHCLLKTVRLLICQSSARPAALGVIRYDPIRYDPDKMADAFPASFTKSRITAVISCMYSAHWAYRYIFVALL